MAIIRLPEPCTVSWMDMALADGGRFCSQCCQVVIDFTQWTPEATLAYLRQHQGACGRFRKDQLDRAIPEPEVFITRLNESVLPFRSRIVLVVVFVFAIMSSSCHTEAVGDRSAVPEEHTAVQSTTGLPLVQAVSQPDTVPAPRKAKLKNKPAPTVAEPVIAVPMENMGGVPVIEEERPVVQSPDSLQ